MLHAADHHRADEEVAAPGGEVLAVVEGEARRCDRRPPHDVRSRELRQPRGLGDRPAAVGPAVGRDGPAVVRAGLDDVGLVAALHAVLGRPQLAGVRVEGEADLVAVAHRPDLGVVVGVADERIVVRGRAVVVQAQQLAEVGASVLGVLPRAGELERTADGHEQLVVRSPDQPRRRNAAAPAVGDEDVARLGQRAGSFVEAPARQRHGGALPAVALLPLRVGEVDEGVVLGMDYHVHQPRQPDTDEDLRHAGDVLVEELPVADYPQRAPVALGHQDVAVAAERHSPRVIEPGHDRHHADARLLGRVEHHRPVRRRQAGHAPQRGGAGAVLGPGRRLEQRGAGDDDGGGEHGAERRRAGHGFLPVACGQLYRKRAGRVASPPALKPRPGARHSRRGGLR